MTGAADGHIHTRHGAFIQQHKALWRYRLLRRGVNKIVSVSVDGREELAKLSGLPVEQIGVVANGVDTEKYKPAVSTQRSAVSDPTIITVARLSPEKDLATLLRAFRLVLDRWGKRPACPSTSADNQAEFDETRSSANGYPTMPLVRMAGSAVRSEATTDSGAPSRRALPQLILVGDGPERSSLEALAQDLNLGNQIKFLGVRNDIPNLLQAADVFALSSISEGLSMALIEAAAYGLPIVATDVGGNAEIVNAPHGGRLVPARNPEAIAVALADVLGDDASRQAMGTAARQHAVANFSLEQMVTTYLKLYDELQIRRGTSPR
jgi:glycosyltransferase involved in cell wall biosynthesis